MILYLICKFYGWLWGTGPVNSDGAAFGALLDLAVIAAITIPILARRDFRRQFPEKPS